MKDGVVYDKFSDPELRYRQRYVDLLVNDNSKEIFVNGLFCSIAMRDFQSAGYLEVDTPVLQSIPAEQLHGHSLPI